MFSSPRPTNTKKGQPIEGWPFFILPISRTIPANQQSKHQLFMLHTVPLYKENNGCLLATSSNWQLSSG